MRRELLSSCLSLVILALHEDGPHAIPLFPSRVSHQLWVASTRLVDVDDWFDCKVRECHRKSCASNEQLECLFDHWSRVKQLGYLLLGLVVNCATILKSFCPERTEHISRALTTSDVACPLSYGQCHMEV